MTNTSLGILGEKAAAAYVLHTKRYVIVEKNYRNRLGEIDIIARDGACLVFIEVKTRQSRRCGRPAEAVERHKQKKIVLTAKAYLHQHNLWNQPCRFDVIEVEPSPKGFAIYHIRHAFLAGD